MNRRAPALSLFGRTRTGDNAPNTVDTRSITLQGRELTYVLRRSRRRTLGLTIDKRGLTVSIPLRVSLREAEAFVQTRSAWIIEKLDEWNSRPVAQTTIADGMRFPLLGSVCVLHLHAGAPKAHWHEGFYQRELHLTVRDASSARRVKSDLLRALQHYALIYFGGRLDEFAYKMQAFAPGIERPALHLTNARTRWGSCSLRSGIRLNWRLIHLPGDQLDYVVAHEMAHLLEMNHSPRFWAVVERLCPDYKTAREALKRAHESMPAW